MIRMIVLTLLLVSAVAAAVAFSDGMCPALGSAHAARGWAALQRGDIVAARAGFQSAALRCPAEGSTKIGLAFVSLREGDANAAKRYVEPLALKGAAEPDVWAALGMAEWRLGEYEAAQKSLTHALALDPRRADAAEYLSRMPPGLRPATNRPPLHVPDTVELVARVEGGRVERVVAGGWQPVERRGADFGGQRAWATPGDFPTASSFRGELERLGAMGARLVRLPFVYPPSFYEALAAYDATHAEPILLVQTVAVRGPGGPDSARWTPETVVDAVHGRADVVPVGGEPSGNYLADVSRWTVAYAYAIRFPDRAPQPVPGAAAAAPSGGWIGDFFVAEPGASPDEIALAAAADRAARYEAQRYRISRPAAFVPASAWAPGLRVSAAPANAAGAAVPAMLRMD